MTGLAECVGVDLVRWELRVTRVCDCSKLDGTLEADAQGWGDGVSVCTGC